MFAEGEWEERREERKGKGERWGRGEERGMGWGEERGEVKRGDDRGRRWGDRREEERGREKGERGENGTEFVYIRWV